MKHLILGSTSARRHQLLKEAGLTFDPARPDIDETPHADEPAAEYVLRLSREKAQAVASQGLRGVILTADTTVADNGEILGKPEDPADAERMIQRLRARVHYVHSGVTALDTDSGEIETQVISTEVHMRDYSDEEIAAYVASGDPMGKAGSYAIQSRSFHPVDHLHGCYTNVVGLPMCAVRSLLAKHHITLRDGHVCSAENLPCQFHFES
ncbi:MAG: Maf family protein [Anaerolineae bacterium]|nr:septum formation protein Maf [Anaerolineae bacterium]